MTTNNIPGDCDVVVIGAGVGGLTAGALLSRAGMNVCILEMGQKPGGYLAGFSRYGFQFDTAIHWLNQYNQGGMIPRLFSLIGDTFPKSNTPQYIKRYKSEYADYTLTSNPDELKAKWIEDYPEDAGGIEKFFSEAKRIGVSFQNICSSFRSGETKSIIERQKFALSSMKNSFPMWKYANASAERGLKRFSDFSLGKKVYCAEESLMACLMPIGWAYTDNYQLPPIGGSREIPRWLFQSARKAGCRTVFGSRVTKILTEHKKANGIQFVKDGEVGELRCRYVIAACDLETVFSKMLPEKLVPSKILKKIRACDLYDSAVTVSLGLDTPAEHLGFGQEFISLARNDIGRSSQHSGDPHLAALNITAPSVSDSTVAPAGKGTLSIYASASMRYGNYWGTGPGLTRGKAYRQFKEDYGNILISRVEEAIAPSLRKHVAFMDVATPITYWRFTHNREGTIMAQRPTARNIRSRVAGYRTPIDNLYIGSHWAEYGGGVPNAVRAGGNSAAIILKKEGLPFFKTLANAMD